MHLKGISRNTKQVLFLNKDNRCYSQDDPFWILEKGCILPATVWSPHCSPEPVCSKISARCRVTGRAQHRELNTSNPGCSKTICFQAGQEVILLLSSALEDQWKTCFLQQKGTKISIKHALKDWVYWHSFSWQVGRIQLCLVQQSSSNFYYWATL